MILNFVNTHQECQRTDLYMFSVCQSLMVGRSQLCVFFDFCVTLKLSRLKKIDKKLIGIPTWLLGSYVSKINNDCSLSLNNGLIIIIVVLKEGESCHYIKIECTYAWPDPILDVISYKVYHNHFPKNPFKRA